MNAARPVIATAATGTPNAVRARRGVGDDRGLPCAAGRRTSVEHKQRAAGRALHDVQRPQNGTEVKDRRPGRDQHQVGKGGNVRHVRFDAGPGIHHHQVDAICPGRVQDAAQLRGLSFHQRRRFCLPGAPPGGGAALGI